VGDQILARHQPASGSAIVLSAMVTGAGDDAARGARHRVASPGFATIAAPVRAHPAATHDGAREQERRNASPMTSVNAPKSPIAT